MNHKTEDWILGVLNADVAAANPVANSHPSLEVLFDYATGGLPPREASLIKSHLLRCPKCTGKLASVNTARQSLVRESIGKAESWSFASWYARREASRAKKYRVRIFSAIAGATASIGLLAAGLARMLLPATSVAIPRDATGAIQWDVVGLLAAGALAACVTLLILLRRK